MIEGSIIFIWKPCNENLEIELLCSLCTSPDNAVNQNGSSTQYIVEQNSESNIVMIDITIRNSIITLEFEFHLKQRILATPSNRGGKNGSKYLQNL